MLPSVLKMQRCHLQSARKCCKIAVTVRRDKTDFDIPTLTTAFYILPISRLGRKLSHSRPFYTRPLLRVHFARIRTDSKRAINTGGIFLVFGACMAALAGTTLAWPGYAS